MRKLASARALGKALAVRAAPGFINLCSLALIANALNISAYGLFSTTVATAGLIANCIFGIGNLSVVAQYASHAGRQREANFVWTLLALWAAMALAAILVGSLASLWMPLALPTLALVMITSLRALLQEIVRAREAVLIYGISDLIQAIGFLLQVYIFVTVETGTAEVVIWLTLSNALALVVHVVHLRPLMSPHRPSQFMAKQIVRMGRWLVITNLTENFLYTGARYLILAKAGPQALGVFSLAVDFAQRTVSFVVNAASFVHVPRAFAARVTEGNAAFIRTLLDGAIVASIAALLAMGAVVALVLTPFFARYVPGDFDIWVFMVVAVAATVNRLKKLVLEPLVIVKGIAHRLPLPNVIGAIIGLGAIMIGTYWSSPLPLSLGYLLGYFANALSLSLIVTMKSSKMAHSPPLKKPVSIGGER